MNRSVVALVEMILKTATNINKKVMKTSFVLHHLLIVSSCKYKFSSIVIDSPLS